VKVEHKHRAQAARSNSARGMLVLPVVKCHVPYGEMQEAVGTMVDLVIVYMYHGDKTKRAHENFFECPNLELESSVKREEAQTSFALSAQHVGLLPIPYVPTRMKHFTSAKAKEGREGVINWVKDPSMLPGTLPDNRTICVGYDLNTVADLGDISYEMAAQKLCEIIGEQREQCINRPIIFIGHGLGCHVIRRVFVGLSANIVGRALQDACDGIIFHHAPNEDDSQGDKQLPPNTFTTEKHVAAAADEPYSETEQTRFTQIIRERSIPHHAIRHTFPDRGQVQPFVFASRNDSTFQQLSTKIAECSKMHLLIEAVTQANFLAVRRLIGGGIDINHRKSASQMTALHLACQSTFTKVQDIELLVRIGKADVTLKDRSGRTPLHHALMMKSPDPEVIKVLLEADADIFALDCNKITPWILAQSTGSDRVQRLLRSQLVKGPSVAKGAVSRAQPHSKLATDVCYTHEIAVTEIYFDSEALTEKHLQRHFSIRDAIYGTKPLQSMLSENRDSPIHDELICRWYHLPANNMQWVEDLISNQFQMHPDIWSEQVRDSEHAHGRCILPHAAQMGAVPALIMPYISYEANYRQRAVNDFVRQHHVRRRAPTTRSKLKELPDQLLQRSRALSSNLDRQLNFDASDDDLNKARSSKLSKTEESLLLAYLPNSLHVRRTLDQYYYYMLEDTRRRDADQVVTRWAEKQLRKSYHNILMVDQLWIWVIKGRDGQPDSVISCFPEREGHGSGALDGLQRNILHHNAKKRQPITTTADLVSRIVTTCSDIFTRSQQAELVRFLHFFEATVVRVGNDEINLLKSFVRRSEILHSLKAGRFDYEEVKHEMLIEMLDIRPQVLLLEEAKDIRDEIKIVLQVLGEQRQVLEDECIMPFFSATSHKADVNFQNAWRKPLDIIKRAIRDFDKMDKQMKGILDDLKHLLDLQQKQATVWEAESSREVARATGRQGNVMVIFTMVTIIFLPLSFCASFFALNIAEFPADERGETNWPLRRLCAYLFGISFAVIIPFIALAFATEWLVAAFHRVESHWLLPSTIKFLGFWSSLPFMKGPCSAAIARVMSRQQEVYPMGERIPTFVDNVYLAAEGVLGDREGDAKGSGFDFEPHKRTPQPSRWSRNGRRRPGDSDV
jgi:hypothetical protein